MYAEEELLALSGIQHFAFCRRQWALIHLEQQWEDNVHTVQGNLVHARAHDSRIREKRGDCLIVRGLYVRSLTLGLAGICDVVEFVRSEDGFPLPGEEGFWNARPVEYKKGRSKASDVDRVQLCAQAICLEEMLCTEVPEAFLYYGKTHSREPVILDKGLRDRTVQLAADMHRMRRVASTPSPQLAANCKACSLQNVCLPDAQRRESVASYYARRLGAME